MSKPTLIASLRVLLEVAREDLNHRRAQHCRKALRRLGAVA